MISKKGTNFVCVDFMERITLLEATKQRESVDRFKRAISPYRSLQDALSSVFGFELKEKFPLETLGISDVSQMSFTVDKADFRRKFLPRYEESYRSALETVFGEGQVPALQASSEFVPPKKTFSLGKSIKNPLENLYWDGKQKLLKFVAKEDEFYLSEVEFELYGVPRRRLELYRSFEDERGEKDFSVYYFPFRLSGDFSRTREDIQVCLNRSGDLMTCRVVAPIDKNQEAFEVLFLSVTNVGTGKTVVLSALYPEFLFIQKQGGNPSANNPDRPVFYLPKDWVANDKSLQQIGRVFGQIDIYYDRFREGIRSFLEYWEVDQSVNARVTNSDLGFSSLVTAASLSLVSSISSEDEASKYTFGLIAGSLWSYLVWGLRRYGRAYQNLQGEIKSRGDDFAIGIRSALND